MTRWSAALLAAYVAAASRGQEKWLKEAERPRPTVRPVAPVSVLVPTLNEVEYVEDCLRSLHRQSLVQAYPDTVEILLVDSGSDDGTVERGRPLADRVLEVPPGKLNALEAAIDAAEHPLLAEADADGIYPEYWLQEILEPLREPDVVGVHGPVYYHDSPVAKRVAAASVPVNAALGKFPAGARAYKRSAYDAIGGFNTRVNQEHLPTLWWEEEFSFATRLRKEGRVVFESGALCFKSARRLDPFFVRDDRASRYRQEVEAGERFGMRSNGHGHAPIEVGAQA